MPACPFLISKFKVKKIQVLKLISSNFQLVKLFQLLKIHLGLEEDTRDSEELGF